jgi:Lanthionine-containing peptide SapB precursor RamS
MFAEQRSHKATSLASRSVPVPDVLPVLDLQGMEVDRERVQAGATPEPSNVSVVLCGPSGLSLVLCE